jgi:hypothetical protein
MTSTIASTHQVVERDPTPLAIPPRPVSAPAFQFHEMHGRLWTYKVTVGGPDALRVIGYVRWTDDDTWVARDRGSAASAASIRKFANQSAAVKWLTGRRR